MEKVDKMLDALGIPKEPPKGSFYDLTSDEEPDGDEAPGGKGEEKRKRGGQPGNQNARKHGLYSKHLTPEEEKHLEGIDEHTGLEPEIALLRLRLNAMLEDPAVSTETLLRTVHTIARLMAIQRRYTYG